MARADFRVSVLIPTKNAGARFERTLEAIINQRLDRPFEVLVIDSGSTDETLRLCRAYGVKIVSVPPSQFGHGRTRNVGIAQCRGEYIVLTVQDAIPADENWLWPLVVALDKDPRVAGAYSRHIAHEGAGFIARQTAEYWHLRQGGRVEQRITDMAAFERLSSDAKQFLCTFNNVSSIIRRSVWERCPFRDVPFAEDLMWGYDVLRAGHVIIYEPASVVRHSHERSNWYELRRAYVGARVLGELFGEAVQPLSLRQLGRLVRLWHAMEHWTAPWRGRSERIRTESEAGLDWRPWYRRYFTRRVLKRIFGPLAPYPESEWADVLYALEKRYRAQFDPEGQALDCGPESLYRRVNEYVWKGMARRLTRAHLDFIFDSLWDHVGRDYVRRAVLEEVASGIDAGGPAIELEIRQFAEFLIANAMQEGILTMQLCRDIWLYATAVNIGRRIGAANRYRVEGRWRQTLERWFLKGI